MRSQEEEGLEEALACLSLSLRDYEEEESPLPPPPPPLRCSPFLTQQGNSPSPLPSPLCRRPSPLSRPPSCLSLPRLSFSQKILEERLTDGLKEAQRATTSGLPAGKGGGVIRKQLFPSHSSPSLGLSQKSTASGRYCSNVCSHFWRLAETSFMFRHASAAVAPRRELAEHTEHAQACRQLVQAAVVTLSQ